MLSNTNFTNAFLANVDFGEAKIYGATFNNAILINANFKAASITGNPTVSTGDFLNAWLHSADFTSATMSNFSLTGAWANGDYQPNSFSSCYLLQPGANNTQFRGYWGTPGKPACLKVKPARNTVTPTINDKTVVCPDGTRSPCGATTWRYGVPDAGLFSQSLHCSILPGNCTEIDMNW